MTEILTESFCERCGTRYTFESSAPRTSRLARVRTLSKGVRNFVMSDEASFSEAMAEARGEEEMAATSHQLDAFHQTFNFCLTCRQYTCGDCWNAPEGRCLTCAPVPGREEAALVAAASPATVAFEPLAETNGHEEEVPGIEAWPEMDLPAERLARVMEPPAAVAAAAAATAIGEAEGAVETVEADGTTDVVEADGTTGAAAPEAAPGVAGVAPGQSLEEAIAAYEAMLASEEQGAVRTGEGVPLEPTPVTEADAQQAEPPVEILLEPEAGSAAWAAAGAMAEPEPVLADVEPPVAVSIAAAGLAAVAAGAEAARSPEPVAAEPEPQPVAAAAEPVAAGAEPQPVAAGAEPVVAGAEPEPSPVDRVEQPTWPIPPPAPATLDAGPAPAPVQAPTPAPWLTVAPEDAPPPEWPAAPVWAGPATRRDVPTTLAGRPLLPQGDAAALWAASAKEVLGAAPATFGAAPQPLAASGPAPQAQPCVSCGLSLSANARFCRRCGSRQA